MTRTMFYYNTQPVVRPVITAFAGFGISLLFFGFLYSSGVAIGTSVILSMFILLLCLTVVYSALCHGNVLRDSGESDYSDNGAECVGATPGRDETGDSEHKFTARQVLPDDLREAGMQPEWDGDSLCFRFQGGYFRALNVDGEIIRIVYPHMFSLSAPYQDLLCRLLNRINSNYALVKLVAGASPDDGVIEVCAFADLYYPAAVEDRQTLLSELLSIFFDAQRSLVLSASLAADDDDEPYIDGACETAYRDFSLN